MDDQHHIVAVGGDTGVLLPHGLLHGVESAAGAVAVAHHVVDAGLKDSLHCVHVLAVIHLDQGEVTVGRGVHAAQVDDLLGQGEIRQTGKEIVQCSGVGLHHEGKFILADGGVIEGLEVHLGGGGAAGAAGAGGTGGAGAAIGGLLPAAPDDAGGLGQLTAKGGGDGGGAGAHGGDGALSVHGGYLLIAGAEEDLHAVRLGGVPQLEGGPGFLQGGVGFVQGDACPLRGGRAGVGGVRLGAVRVGSIWRGGVGLRAVGSGAVRRGGIRVRCVRVGGVRLAGADAVRAAAGVGRGGSAGLSAAGGQGQDQSGRKDRCEDTSFHSK